MRVLLAALAMMVLMAAPLRAHEYTAGTLFVYHPAVNATAPGANTAAGYFSIKNNGDDDDQLLSIEAPTLASVAEIHSMSMNDGVMSMRKLKSLPILVGQQVNMTPAGIHIMFAGLKQQIKEGEKYPAILHFMRAGDVEVTLNVEPVGSVPEHAHSPAPHAGTMDMDPSAAHH